MNVQDEAHDVCNIVESRYRSNNASKIAIHTDCASAVTIVWCHARHLDSTADSSTRVKPLEKSRWIGMKVASCSERECIRQGNGDCR